jgi:hypothetical protein
MWEKAHRVPSRYEDTFDYRIYDQLYERFGNNQPRGGVVYKGTMKFLEAQDCAQCFHRFEIDTYGRGCIHNCAYCYAKSYLSIRRYWNAPIPFMWLDKKYRVTLELLKILRFYKYPYIIFTRSDLIAQDEYMRAMDPHLASVQMSLASINEQLTRQLEPGAPAPSKRLRALQTRPLLSTASGLLYGSIRCSRSTRMATIPIHTSITHDLYSHLTSSPGR